MLNDEYEVEMKTKNKLIMDYAVEHAEAISGSIEELQKVNK